MRRYMLKIALHNHIVFRNVIDVAALDSHTLEQHEYQDRVTHYTQRLNGLAVMQRWRAPPTKVCILADMPNPEKLLSTDGVHPNDLQMVKLERLKAVFF